jgi:hypothetical protein
MPKLIKKIEGEFFETIIGDVIYSSSLTGEIQSEDYINLNGFIGYLQNFTKVENLTELTKPINFGLKNKYNILTVTLEIDY